MNKQFWKAALNRALRTVAQTLVGSIPTGFIVTANMIKSLDINVLWAILAWLATGLLAGGISVLMSVATGLPEVERVDFNKADSHMAQQMTQTINKEEM